MNLRTHSGPSLAVATCLTAAALAGCGGGGDEEPARGRASATGGVQARGGQALIDAQTAMARCMRRQGIDFPDPSPGRGFQFDPRERGIDEQRLRAAERRCARYGRAIAEAAPRPSQAELQRGRDQTLRYARCMRRHGVDVPDPRPSGGDAGTAVEVPPDAKTDPTFQRASRQCERLLRGG